MTTQAESETHKSTIVRPRRRLVPAWIPAGFGVLELVAPQVGARRAERLWFAVPAARAARGTATAALAGEPFEVPVNGGRVVGEAWGDGPLIYLLHGWGGWRAQLSALVPALVEAGYRVIAFDTPSHGDSSPGLHGPRQSTLLEFEAALAAVVGRHGPAYAVVAHSGGAPAAALAVRHGLPVRRLVFIAPMAHPEPYLRTFARQLGIGPRTYRRLVRRIVDRVGVPMAHFDVAGLAADVPERPLLVLHDKDDAEVGWSDAAAIVEAWAGARLVSTTGLGHRRILRDPQVVAEVRAFVVSS
jgi:pimeloyl-ACP methyl ester carboxylesterase